MNAVKSETEPGTLLVGIANPNTIERLMTLAVCAHHATGCEVVATHIVTVPKQIALASARSSREVSAARELLRRAIRAGAAGGIDVRGVVEVGRDVDEGLMAAAHSQGATVLLVGYSDDRERGASSSAKAERSFDRIMHHVARRVDADLVVAKFRREAVGSILVAVPPAPDLRLTGLLARAVAEGTGASVRFLHLGTEEGEGEPRAPEIRRRLEDLKLLELGELEVVRRPAWEEALVEYANRHDLVILEASPRPSLADTVLGSAAERIASQTTASVLLARTQR